MQIEVAMQNSALSVSLALKHFTPQAAVAGAVFSIIHNFTGSIFAGICRKHDDQEKIGKCLIVNSHPHLSNLYPKYACFIHYLDILKDEGFLYFH